MNIETKPFGIYKTVQTELALLAEKRLEPVEITMTEKEHDQFLLELRNDPHAMSYILHRISHNQFEYNGIPIRIVPELNVEKTKREMGRRPKTPTSEKEANEV